MSGAPPMPCTYERSRARPLHARKRDLQQDRSRQRQEDLVFRDVLQPDQDFAQHAAPGEFHGAAQAAGGGALVAHLRYHAGLDGRLPFSRHQPGRDGPEIGPRSRDQFPPKRNTMPPDISSWCEYFDSLVM